MWKCPSSIWSWDSNPRPIEHDSPAITTRQRLPTYFLTSCSLSITRQLTHCCDFYWRNLAKLQTGNLFSFCSPKVCPKFFFWPSLQVSLPAASLTFDTHSSKNENDPIIKYILQFFYQLSFIEADFSSCWSTASGPLPCCYWANFCSWQKLNKPSGHTGWPIGTLQIPFYSDESF